VLRPCISDVVLLLLDNANRRVCATCGVASDLLKLANYHLQMHNELCHGGRKGGIILHNWTIKMKPSINLSIMVHNSTGAQTTLPFPSMSRTSAPNQIQPHESGLESKMVGPTREKFLIVPPQSTVELLKTLLDRGWFVPPIPEVILHTLSSD
jgi:hypothetical protein